MTVDTAVRVGFEFCERLMLTLPISGVSASIREAKEHGLAIHFALPVPHEAKLSEVAAWISHLSREKLVDAWIVNDVGMLRLLEEHDPQKSPVILGRLFDKSLHESRYPLMPQGLQSELSHHFVSAGALARYLLEHQLACGMEVDFSPGTTLDVSAIAATTNCYVHLHTMFVGCTDYCLFGVGEGQSLTDVRLGACCTQRCASFVRKINLEHSHPIYQVGNAFFSLRTSDPSTQVSGVFLPILHPSVSRGGSER